MSEHFDKFHLNFVSLLDEKSSEQSEEGNSPLVLYAYPLKFIWFWYWPQLMHSHPKSREALTVEEATFRGSNRSTARSI